MDALFKSCFYYSKLLHTDLQVRLVQIKFIQLTSIFIRMLSGIAHYNSKQSNIYDRALSKSSYVFKPLTIFVKKAPS